MACGLVVVAFLGGERATGRVRGCFGVCALRYRCPADVIGDRVPWRRRCRSSKLDQIPLACRNRLYSDICRVMTLESALVLTAVGYSITVSGDPPGGVSVGRERSSTVWSRYETASGIVGSISVGEDPQSWTCKQCPIFKINRAADVDTARIRHPPLIYSSVPQIPRRPAGAIRLGQGDQGHGQSSPPQHDLGEPHAAIHNHQLSQPQHASPNQPSAYFAAKKRDHNETARHKPTAGMTAAGATGSDHDGRGTY
jgi:hypothetical protein